jgi:Spy/CpxP family protein refolding chaperone
MKKLWICLAVFAVFTAASSVQAGCGKCPGDKPAAAAAGTAGAKCLGSDIVSKLNLTDDQKAKVEATRQQCDKAATPEECRKICTEGMAKILTPEQLKQWNEATADCTGKGKCPFKEAAAKPADKSAPAKPAASGHDHKGCTGH